MVLDEERSWRVSSCAKSYDKAKEFWQRCRYLIPIWQSSSFLSQVYEQFRLAVFVFFFKRSYFLYKFKDKNVFIFQRTNVFSKSFYFMEKSDSLYCLTLCYQGNNWAQFTFCGSGIIPDTFLNISCGILFLICFPRLYFSTSFVYFSYLFYYYDLFSSEFISLLFIFLFFKEC